MTLDPRLQELQEMLTYKRVAGSKTERKFINRFLMTLPHTPIRDQYGNIIVTVGHSPNILWSSHTDTVHRTPGRQEVWIDEKGIISTNSGECLGADCGTGVWLMMNMIRADIPGLYIFHRDEESGGGGSLHIAKKTPELLKDIKYAVAFDRKGTKSVITEQWGGRCCSDEFGRALGDAIADKWFELDELGSFTDTANYTELVPECTNLSVGYYNQHTKSETQDSKFAISLLGCLLAADFSNLPVVRDPSVIEAYEDRWGHSSRWDGWAYDYKTHTYGSGTVKAHDIPSKPSSDLSRKDKYQRLVDLCAEHPHVAADFLEGCGIDVDEFLEVAFGGVAYG